MMETWKQCGWAPCGKRFEPSRRSNRHQRATASRHDDAIYCSRACRQKAYRWRSRAVTRTSIKATTRRAVTRPSEHIENTKVFLTKIDHARPPEVIAGLVERYSARSLRAAGLPLDPLAADYQRQLNDPDRVRRETAWGRRRVPMQIDGAPSDWKPSSQPHWPSPSSDDLSIPDFLKRESAAVSESPEGLLVAAE